MPVHAPSGPGRTTVCKTQPMGGVRAVLSNYDATSNVLKSEHIRFLTEAALPLLVDRNAMVWLHSLVPLGTPAQKASLIRQRLSWVASFLQQHGVATSQIEIETSSGGMSATRIPESLAGEAVSLVVAEFGPPVVRAQDMGDGVSAQSSSFKIQTIASLSVKPSSVAIDRLGFRIWDTENNVAAYYDFVEQHETQPAVLASSPTIRGSWLAFDCSAPVSLASLGGRFRLTCSADPWRSTNSLFLVESPAAVTTDPGVLVIPSGFTMGSAPFTRWGTLVLTSVERFSGD